MSEEQLKELQEYNLEYLEAQSSEEIFGGDYTSEVELKYAKKEIERLNNIIDELEKILSEKIEAVKCMKETLGTSVYKVNPHIDILEKEYNYFSDKIKELKESDK